MIYHYHIWKIEVGAQLDKHFLYYLLEAETESIKASGNGIAMTHATKGGMEQRLFPVPPLETQRTIVADLEAERTLVAANRELIERMEKKIETAIARVWAACPPEPAQIAAE